ncbi:MAG: DNA replication/repair protein RecF [Anaerolineaceae bacterium]|nr:DNA replication/repair protein RecF [Anaerolineaceae bacterium]
MHLTHLALTDFRSFSRLDLDVPRRLLLLVGDNAQGKTSLLESVYYLSTFTSFFAQTDRQLVNFNAESAVLLVTRLVADYCRGEKQHKMEVRLIQENGGNGGVRTRREILLDGVKRTAQEALGHFNAVLFLPRMMSIIEGAPEERRKYLNLTIAQALPGYARVLGDYHQGLTQRNALLKQLSEKGGDPAQLQYWDDLLAEKGGHLIHTRIAAIAEIERMALQIHEHLTDKRDVLRLSYQPAYDPLPAQEGQYLLRLDTPVQRSGISLEEIRQGFASRLRALHREEIQRGVTTIGPHRDELRILENGIDLGDFGSRGQTRTALLSLKLAEVKWLKQKTGYWPVLLLDEFLAELDKVRRKRLLEFLEESEQALLSTTDLHSFEDGFIQGSTVWTVKAGQVKVQETLNGG